MTHCSASRDARHAYRSDDAHRLPVSVSVCICYSITTAQVRVGGGRDKTARRAIVQKGGSGRRVGSRSHEGQVAWSGIAPGRAISSAARFSSVFVLNDVMTIINCESESHGAPARHGRRPPSPGRRRPRLHRSARDNRRAPNESIRRRSAGHLAVTCGDSADDSHFRHEREPRVKRERRRRENCCRVKAQTQQQQRGPQTKQGERTRRRHCCQRKRAAGSGHRARGGTQREPGRDGRCLPARGTELLLLPHLPRKIKKDATTLTAPPRRAGERAGGK